MCGTCLTHKEDNVTGYCINGHDNWVEPMDVEYFILDRTNKDYPHINPMFKTLARKLKLKIAELHLILAKNPRYLFTKKFV